jgi:hypothetical protein
MNDRALRDLIKKPQGWRILLPGTYLASPNEPSRDQRCMAALLYAGSGSVITGAAAVWRHGVPCPDPGMIDVLIDDKRHLHRKSTRFVRVQRTTRLPENVRIDNKIRFTYLPRATGDAARTMTDLNEVKDLIFAVIKRTSCTVEILLRELNAGPTAGSRFFRIALAEASAGIRSVAEADLKKLIDKSGIEKPIYNPELYLPDGTFLCSPDTWWEKYGIAGEVDSVAFHLLKDRNAYENTQKRHNRMERHGIRVLHWAPATIRHDGTTVLLDIKTALANGARNEPPQIITVPAGQNPPTHCRPPRGRPARPLSV